MKRTSDLISNTSANRFEVPLITINPSTPINQHIDTTPEPTANIAPQLRSGFSSSQEVRNEFHAPLAIDLLNSLLYFPPGEIHRAAIVNRPITKLLGRPTAYFMRLASGTNTGRKIKNTRTFNPHINTHQNRTNNTGLVNNPAWAHVAGSSQTNGNNLRDPRYVELYEWIKSKQSGDK